MSEYDIYLNSKGYMLARDRAGQFVSGAARQQYTNPFARFLATDEKYARATFRFGDGAGLAEYDGSHRYQSSFYTDTRSGKVIAGALQELCQSATGTEKIVSDKVELGTISLSNNGDHVGIAERFVTPAGQTAIRSVAIFVKRHPTHQYESASDFTVAIYTNGTGQKPNALVGSKTVSLKKEKDAFLPFADRWPACKWFWLQVTFDSNLTVTASTPYWIVITNAQDWRYLYVAEYSNDTPASLRSTYNGTTWTDGATDHSLFFKLRYPDEIECFPRCFAEFRGSDGFKRLYAGVGYKVMYYKESGLSWANSKKLTDPVLQLLVFDYKLFAAQGPDNDLHYTDGASGTTTWTAVTGQQAQCMAVHDAMLWKADGASVHGSTDGTTWTGAVVTFGDPGSPVMSMVSHGGKLFAAKPEGIAEITYPSTYPGSGTPVANMMLDFRTEIAPRTWALDWHSGLYFPGYGGVYELKSGILRNLWTEKLDEGVLEVSTPDQQFTRPARWSPLYDARPGGYAQACGTSRGIYLAHAHPHLEPSDIWFYDGRNWHELGPVGVVGQQGGTGLPNHLQAEYCLAIHLQDLGGGKGRLWYGQGTNIGYMYWPTWTNDRRQDALTTYALEATEVTRVDIALPTFSLPEKNKAIHLCKVGVTCRDTAALKDINLYYRLDGASAWTVLTGGSVGLPYYEVEFGAGIIARTVELRAGLNNATDPFVAGPVLVQLDLFYQPVMSAFCTHQVTIHAGDSLDLRTGGTDSRTAKQILAELEALADGSAVSSPGVFAYIDPCGNSHNVKVTGLSIQYLHQHEAPGAVPPPTAYAILSLLEI